jgi:hypothetical protein
MQGVLSSTGHLPEWLASARTTRQSSTGDPYISGSFTAAGWGYQHTGFGSVQQTEAGTPHPAAAAAAVVSSAAEADAAAVLLVEGSGGSKGGFGSLSPFVCAGEVVSDGEEAEVLGALQQQLQLAEVRTEVYRGAATR